jgi:hypothetical protein
MVMPWLDRGSRDPQVERTLTEGYAHDEDVIDWRRNRRRTIA